MGITISAITKATDIIIDTAAVVKDTITKAFWIFLEYILVLTTILYHSILNPVWIHARLVAYQSSHTTYLS